MRFRLGTRSWFINVALAVAAGVLPPSAHARGSGGGDRGGSRPIVTAEGISSPARATSLFENPAGLSGHGPLAVHGFVSSSSTSFSPLSEGVLVGFGGGTVGGALGVTHSSGGTSGHFGLGADLGPLALGLAGTLSSSGGSALGNAGVLFNPDGDLRVGVVAYQVFDGITGYGAGVSTDVGGSGATVAVDAGADSDLDTVVVKPGISISVDRAQLTVAQGIRVVGNGSGGGVATGTMFGLGFFATPSAHLYAYLDHLSRIWVGLSVSF